MTMPEFDPVAWRYELKASEYTFAEKRYLNETYAPRPTALHTAGQLAEAYEAGKREASEDIEQAAFEKWLYDKCPSGDVDSVQRQWLESYEYAELAGKRDATPEGYALVPKQPTLLMLRAMYPCESTTEAYKAMLAAAPERRRMMTLVELLQQAASESDTPNTSIEGKAANLIERQAAQIEMMREALGYRIDHPKVITALSFTPDQALEQFAAKVRSQCESVARSGEWGLTKTGKAIAAAIGRIKDLP